MPTWSLRDVLGRLGCSPAEALALLLLALGALAVVATLWLLGGRLVPAAPATATAPTGEDARASPTPGVAVTAGEVVVHVAGLVARPGVYTLPGGSRVADALEAAGGPRRSAVLDALNLARPLTDGEQLVVGDAAPGAPAPGTVPGTVPAAPAAPAPTPGAGAPSVGALVSINTATEAQLDELPGIGPVLAERIVMHRTEVGGFTEVGQLRDVSGIGEITFQELAPLVTL